MFLKRLNLLYIVIQIKFNIWCNTIEFIQSINKELWNILTQYNISNTKFPVIFIGVALLAVKIILIKSLILIIIITIYTKFCFYSLSHMRCISITLFIDMKIIVYLLGPWIVYFLCLILFHLYTYHIYYCLQHYFIYKLSLYKYDF